MRLSKSVYIFLTVNIPPRIRPCFIGASLCVLKNKDVSISPIAVSIIRLRLLARKTVKSACGETATMLGRKELGFGILLISEKIARAI